MGAMTGRAEAISGSIRRQPTLRELLEAARAEPEILSGHPAARRMQRRVLNGLGAMAALALVAGTGLLARHFNALLGG